MQLFALEGSCPVSATKAEKGKNYVCPECRSAVRVRGGLSRQTHFYHFRASKNCRQNQKSLEHLQLQLRLLDLIGGAEAQIECSFPAIQRIADVAWHARKIIFEVQCSPITLQEVEQRVLDYQKEGYRVVWILHDKQFNKGQLSASENYLRALPCYFTNINKTGEGIVYDQFEVLKAGRRVFKGAPLIVAPVKMIPIPKVEISSQILPKLLLNRLLAWQFYAKGDLLDRLLREGVLSPSAKKMIAIESGAGKKENKIQRLSCLTLLAKSYLGALDWLLKKSG